MRPEPAGHRRTLQESEKVLREAKLELERFRPVAEEIRRVEGLFSATLANRRSGEDRRAEGRDTPDRRR